MSSQLFIEQLLNGIQFGFMLFLMSAGLTLIFGVMGLINLAHGSFFMVGAFSASFVAGLTGNFFLAILASLILPALIGIMVEFSVIRKLYERDHLDQVLATFALILIFSEATRYIFGAFPLFLDIPNLLQGNILLPGEIVYSKYRLIIIIIGLLVAVGLYFLINRTLLGIQIKAGQNDRQMIRVLGINISRLYTIVFAMGAALAGLAGALIGAIQSVEVGMGEPVLILAFVVIVIGGIGSIKGALIGALLIGVLDTMARLFLPIFFELIMETSQALSLGSSLASMSAYVLMALVLIFRPTGLFGKK
mgnify:FL=1